MTSTLEEHIPSDYAIREEFVALLLGDLRGPKGGPEEEVDSGERMTDRYPLGSLAPRGARLEVTDDDDLSIGGEIDDDSGDSETAEARVPSHLLPSSIGLSFTVDGSVEVLVATARWGRYERTDSEVLIRDDGAPKRVYKRTPMGGSPILIRLPEVALGEDHEFGNPDPVVPGVVISGRVRRPGDYWIVTLFLRNNQESTQRNKDTQWLFQAEVEVTAGDGRPVFLHHQLRNDGIDDVDQAELDMLYRDECQYATGHGTAVDAIPSLDHPGGAVRLVTVSVPRYEVPRTEAPAPSTENGLEGLVLDMKTLGEVSDGGFGPLLSPLTSGYADWIKRELARLGTPALHQHQAAGSEAMARAKDALERIRAGIELLDRDSQAAEAFRFANRAMHLQRLHTIWAESRRNAAKGEDPSLEELDLQGNRSWRPFQLAFILSNLPSLTDLHHADRSTEPSAAADLLWFPTGGGKTEAYLGLTAYTLGVRRLQGEIEGHDGEHGVAVIMRYTLRLLTLQQFQRATALMCACEDIRRQDTATWGETPYRIGLWVGMSMTPNRTSQAHQAISNKTNQGFALRTGNPHQLTSCPWCGSAIDRNKDIDVELPERGRGRTLIYCGDKRGQCLFSRKRSQGEGLPVLVVDEEIYRNPPSLLIATVDKFAQMPWKGSVQNLFGKVEDRCERHGFHAADFDDTRSHRAVGSLPAAKTVPVIPLRPPDLIIQDELHLISGPLGSLVGLFETAVDDLASWTVEGKGVRPKLIASTATIRRAADQIHALFLRGVNVFPPNGLDAKDNFFSIQREPSETAPGRLYLGVCARGTRLKSVLIRVYLALLASAQTLYERYGDRADHFMTLVGYFGALRELGGMRRLVDDDIRQRLRSMATRGLASRQTLSVKELTSRLNSEQVPNVLEDLGIPHSSRDKSERRYPIDVLLATNMISVGVDVSRLGLMVVAGQPKNTAEYIQATSRVGRQSPGLVVTVYNWARPRDLSHYEDFGHYHATLYRQVEPLSVTPFAPRAIDRGLTSVMASMVRLSDDELAQNQGAGLAGEQPPVLDDVSARIVRRAAAVTGDAGTVTKIEADLASRRVEWIDEAADRQGSDLAWEQKRDGTSVALLKQADGSPWEMFSTLNSLRNIEPGIGMILRGDLPWPSRAHAATTEEQE